MNSIKRPINRHQIYHAHVYFEQETLAQAQQLCAQAGEQFGLRVGRVHQRPIGPHTMWSCQIVFDNKEFESLIPWLDAHRNGLSVLVHGLTGDDLQDHTEHAYWLGEQVILDLSEFVMA
ncbi:DOPA 4,5-dioxygenase family protein [uncultured Ferrimonas sp.]|uniref:DOPA 4,5-dioxygenase family protein n=1 Tax=uncultured Ferrimonas sp. TaxID=432640 RepID=UPI00260419E0|nr:DOPA 4,5-dioxygenase family protein [uncultured Ferrimonas sp.]